MVNISWLWKQSRCCYVGSGTAGLLNPKQLCDFHDDFGHWEGFSCLPYFLSWQQEKLFSPLLSSVVSLVF